MSTKKLPVSCNKVCLLSLFSIFQNYEINFRKENINIKKSGNSRWSFAERWYVFRRKLVFYNVEAYWKKRRHVWGKTSRRFLKTIKCFRKRINSFGSVEIFLANVIEILRFALDDKEQGGLFCERVKGQWQESFHPYVLSISVLNAGDRSVCNSVLILWIKGIFCFQAGFHLLNHRWNLVGMLLCHIRSLVRIIL